MTTICFIAKPPSKRFGQVPAIAIAAFIDIQRDAVYFLTDSGTFFRSFFGCIKLLGVAVAVGAVVACFAGGMPVFGTEMPAMAVVAKIGNHGIAISGLGVVSSRLGLFFILVTSARFALAGGTG